MGVDPGLIVCAGALLCSLRNPACRFCSLRTSGTTGLPRLSITTGVPCDGLELWNNPRNPPPPPEDGGSGLVETACHPGPELKVCTGTGVLTTPTSGAFVFASTA